MAFKTYTVGQNSGVRRLDDLTLPWVDIPLNLLDLNGVPIDGLLRDVMTDPNDENKVFVVGYRDSKSQIPGIYWSDNAGVTWNKPGGDISDPLKQLCRMLYEVWVVDSNTIYAVGDGGYVFKSVDGGLTFNETTTAPTFSGTPGDLEYIGPAIHFPDAMNGCIIQDRGTFQYVFYTSDGGATWNNTAIGPPGLTYTPGGGIHMSADYQNITALFEAGIWRSTDGGATFVEVHNLGERNGVHLTWTDDSNLWAYGKGGHRLRSTDGGATWVDIATYDVTKPIHRAGHHYLLPSGFYSENYDILTTPDESVTGSLSETSPYGVSAVWTGGVSDSPPPCGCPDGYTLNPVTGLCEQVITTDPICPSTKYLVGPGDFIQAYGFLGANFYDDSTGRPLPITETASTLEDASSAVLNVIANVSNTLWNNRLNTVGIWATTLPNPLNEWIGFSTCVNVPVDGTYCIGIAGDNYVRFRIDGVPYVEMSTGSTWTFNHWHVIPITLTAGIHYIEIEGLNLGSQASFGAEIYSVDALTLSTMTTVAELSAVTIFSTADKIGLFFDLGEQSGCQCPDGLALSTCADPYICIGIDTVPFIPCNQYLATNCENPNEQIYISINPALPPLDTNLIYEFDEYPDKCWTVEPSEVCEPCNYP